MTAAHAERSHPLRRYFFAMVCIALGVFFLLTEDRFAGTSLRGVGFALAGAWLLLEQRRWRRAGLVGWAAAVCLVVGYTLRYADALRQFAVWLF